MGACVDTFGHGPQRLIPLDTAGALACHVAAADVDVYRVASAEAHLDEPVRGGLPGLLAAAALRLAAFFGGDPPVDLLDLLYGDAAVAKRSMSRREVELSFMCSIVRRRSPQASQGRSVPSRDSCFATQTVTSAWVQEFLLLVAQGRAHADAARQSSRAARDEHIRWCGYFAAFWHRT